MPAAAGRDSHWTPPLRLGLWLMIGLFLPMRISATSMVGSLQPR